MRQSVCSRLYVSVISPISISGFSLHFCHWCILGQSDQLIRFWGLKVKVTYSRRGRPAIDAAIKFSFLVLIIFCIFISIGLAKYILIFPFSVTANVYNDFAYFLN